MFGLGAWEVVVILLLALIVLGPQKLPEVAKKLARFAGELRRVSDEVRRNFDEATRDMPDIRAPMHTPPQTRPAPVASVASHEAVPAPVSPAPEAQAAAEVPLEKASGPQGEGNGHV